MKDALVRSVRKIRRSDVIDALNLEVARLREELAQSLAALAAREQAHLEFASDRDDKLAQLKQDLTTRREIAESLVREVDLVRAERDVLLERMADREAILSHARSDLTRLVIEHDAVVAKEAGLRAEAVRLDQDRMAALGAVDELRVQVASLELRLETRHREIELAAQVQIQLQHKAEEIALQLERLAAESETLKRDRDSALAEADEARRQKAAASAEALQLSSAVARISDTLESISQTMSSELAAARAQVGDQEKQLVELGALLTAAQAQVGALAGERDALRAECERLGASETDLLAERDALNAECIRRGASAATLIEERDALRAECTRLGASETKLLADIQSLITGVEGDGSAHLSRASAAAVTLHQSSQGKRPAKSTGRRYFVTTSLGRTATQWLTSTLNRHPQILATHALDLSSSKRPVASQGNDFVASLDRQDWIRAKFSNLDEAFDLFDNHAFKVVGNIHGLDALEAVQHPEMLQRRYYGSYLTRHPIPRVRSLVNRWKYENNLSERRRLANVDAFRDLGSRFDRLVRKHSVTLSEDDQLFLLALSYLLPAEARYLQSDLPIIVYERLVREHDYLLWHLTEISDGQIEFEDDFVGSALELDAVDQRSNGPQLARREYHAWQAWQREAFADLVAEAGTERAYRELGYETFFS